MPGCKWTNWDTGLHTALIARWPNRIARGQRTDALVQYADVLPTLLDMAGGDTEKHSYDGTSFRRVLLGEAQQHRKYVYGAHNNVPEGPSYPIRSVSDGRYRFIQNLAPQELYIERHLMGRQGEGKVNNPYWATWIGDAGSDAQIYALVKRYMRRPAEELYLTAADPYELSNLAGVPEHRAAQERLATELRRWLVAQGDPGAPLDTTAAWEAAEQGRHLYVAPKSP